jgi:hypothetical protein
MQALFGKKFVNDGRKYVQLGLTQGRRGAII